MEAVRTVNLTKYYGKAKGVEDINLEVKQGEVFGFIGPNGAGKSTTIRMIMQLIYPTSGSISIFGKDVKGDDPAIRRDIGYLPSEINFYKELTGRQMLEFAARAFEVDTLKPIDEYADILELDLTKKIKSYSLGNRKKLATVQCLLHEPKLLILDEPTSGLDPLMQNRFFEILREKNEKGMTIFLSTHVLSEVEKICTRVGIIRNGELIQVSSVDEIPGKSEKYLIVKFSEPGNLIEKLNFKAIDPKVKFEEDSHIFHVDRHINQVLQKISEYAITDIAVKQPTLEELFMSYYGNQREEF